MEHLVFRHKNMGANAESYTKRDSLALFVLAAGQE
jgi:hypothetical protein